jgi:hypothetical protein
MLRSEFCNYAVGPWVSVAGRETALARGNPAMKKGISILDFRVSIALGHSSGFQSSSKIDIRK